MDRRSVALALGAIALSLTAAPAVAKKKVAPPPKASAFAVPAEVLANPANRWILDLSNGGHVVIQLRPDLAPGHVQRIQQLTQQGFYNGLLFHRVIPGFMAQGGDPQGNGQGGSTLPDLKAEFNNLPHVRGVLSMARAEPVDSANSQFFIILAPTFKLDHEYTGFGRVIEGMAAVDNIAAGEPPAQPTRILKATLGAPVAITDPLPAAAPAPTPTPAPEPAPAPAEVPPAQ